MCALNGPTILVAVDAAVVALEIELALQAKGASTRSAPRIADALDLIYQERIDFALIDSRLEDGDSSAVRDVLRDRRIKFCVLVNAGRSNQETYDEAAFVIAKPFRLDDFVAQILHYV